MLIFFLFYFVLLSVLEGVWSALGEFELASNGVGREQMVMSLCYGYAAAVIAAPILGVLSDFM